MQRITIHNGPNTNVIYFLGTRTLGDLQIEVLSRLNLPISRVYWLAHSKGIIGKDLPYFFSIDHIRDDPTITLFLNENGVESAYKGNIPIFVDYILSSLMINRPSPVRDPVRDRRDPELLEEYFHSNIQFDMCKLVKEYIHELQHSQDNNRLRPSSNLHVQPLRPSNINIVGSEIIDRGGEEEPVETVETAGPEEQEEQEPELEDEEEEEEEEEEVEELGLEDYSELEEEDEEIIREDGTRGREAMRILEDVAGMEEQIDMLQALVTLHSIPFHNFRNGGSSSRSMRGPRSGSVLPRSLPSRRFNPNLGSSQGQEQGQRQRDGQREGQGTEYNFVINTQTNEISSLGATPITTLADDPYITALNQLGQALALGVGSGSFEDVRITIREDEFESVVLPMELGADDMGNCSICLTELNNGDIRQLKVCGHLFHKNCIETQLVDFNCRCPTCRADVRAVN